MFQLSHTLPSKCQHVSILALTLHPLQSISIVSILAQTLPPKHADVILERSLREAINPPETLDIVQSSLTPSPPKEVWTQKVWTLRLCLDPPPSPYSRLDIFTLKV